MQTTSTVLVLASPKAAAAAARDGRAGDSAAAAVSARDPTGDRHVRDADQFQLHDCSLRAEVSGFHRAVASESSNAAIRLFQSHRFARLHSGGADRPKSV